MAKLHRKQNWPLANRVFIVIVSIEAIWNSLTLLIDKPLQNALFVFEITCGDEAENGMQFRLCFRVDFLVVSATPAQSQSFQPTRPEPNFCSMYCDVPTEPSRLFVKEFHFFFCCLPSYIIGTPVS